MINGEFMMDVSLPFELDYKPHLGHKTDYGIGMVGMGGIVQDAHLPAYRKAGFRVVACHDLNLETAQRVAKAYDIPRVYAALDDLLTDPAVEVVDIAVPPQHQLSIVQKVVAAGKPMLCQKPLAYSFGDAQQIVALAQQAGVKQAVNQQMRWDAGIRASRDLIRRGLIGQPAEAQIQVSVATPWHLWPWLASQDKLEILNHSIHHLDAMRFLFGDPEWVTSRHTRYVNQGAVKGETKTITILDYADGLQALVAVNHYNQQGDPLANFRFIGTEGAIEGTIGLLYDYPTGRPDTLEIRSTQFGQGIKITPTIHDMWFPDAFVGTMASLMLAVETDTPPIDNSTADNLNTLRLVHGAYLSAQENRSVRPSEIA